MERKINQIIDYEFILDNIKEEMSYVSFKLFLIDNSKKAMESMSGYSEKIICELVGASLRNVCSKILRKKVYLILRKDEDNYYNFNLSKIKIPKQGKKEYNLFWGELFGIPKCCIKKYCEDSLEGDSFNSAIRYFNQCYDTNKEDKFGVEIVKGNCVSCNFGFIPCGPKCKNASEKLKLIEKIDNLYKKIVYEDIFKKKVKGGKK